MLYCKSHSETNENIIAFSRLVRSSGDYHYFLAGVNPPVADPDQAFWLGSSQIGGAKKSSPF